MERLSISQQTLKEFLEQPFGYPNEQKQLKYEDRYQSFKKNNRIRIESTMELDKNYFIHVQVPSESQKGLSYYDVVVQFFTPNKECEKQLNLNNYYVQFFSNSPGFVYKYAALYSMQGYLIESLMDKFQPGILSTLPDKANKNYELFFDSTIYYACRYIMDNRLTTMMKLNFKIYKTKRPAAFFGDIQDIEESEIHRSSASLERKIREEIRADTKLSEQQETKLKRIPFFHKEITSKRDRERNSKKKAKASTFKNPNERSVVKKASKSTGNKTSSVVVRKAGLSTKRKP